MTCPTARPERSVRQLAALVAALLALAVLPGCSAPGPGGGRPIVRVEAPEWVALPASGWDRAAEPCTYFATGRAPPDRNATLAEGRARDAALEAVSAFVDAALTRLDAVFAERAAGVLEPAALAAVRSDPGLRRQLTDSARAAARIQGKWQDDDNFCVWIRLDAQAGLLDGYEQALARRLDSQARELTPDDRVRLRAGLEQVVAERNASR